MESGLTEFPCDCLNSNRIQPSSRTKDGAQKQSLVNAGAGVQRGGCESLFRLNFDRFRQVEWPADVISDLNRPTMLQVGCNHAGPRPIQVPSVVDLQQSVRH